MLLLLFEENVSLYLYFTHFDPCEFSLEAKYFEFDNAEKSKIRILFLSLGTPRIFSSSRALNSYCFVMSIKIACALIIEL